MKKNIIAITAITRDEWMEMYNLAYKIADGFIPCNILDHTYYALLRNKIKKAIGEHIFYDDYIKDKNDNLYTVNTDFNFTHKKMYIYCYQI